MKHWMVTWDGRCFRKFGTNQQQAEAFAERWQGERYHAGMMKHGDKGDYFEVKRDTQAEREFDERYGDLKAGKPQRVVMQQRVED